MANRQTQEVWDLIAVGNAMRLGTYAGVPPLHRPRGRSSQPYWQVIQRFFGQGRYAQVIANAPEAPPRRTGSQPWPRPHSQPGFDPHFNTLPRRIPGPPRNPPTAPQALAPPTLTANSPGLDLLNSGGPPPVARSLPLRADDTRRKLREEHGVPVDHIAGENTTQYARPDWSCTEDDVESMRFSNPTFQLHVQAHEDGTRGLRVPDAVGESFKRHSAEWRQA